MADENVNEVPIKNPEPGYEIVDKQKNMEYNYKKLPNSELEKIIKEVRPSVLRRELISGALIFGPILGSFAFAVAGSVLNQGGYPQLREFFHNYDNQLTWGIALTMVTGACGFIYSITGKRGKENTTYNTIKDVIDGRKKAIELTKEYLDPMPKQEGN